MTTICEAVDAGIEWCESKGKPVTARNVRAYIDLMCDVEFKVKDVTEELKARQLARTKSRGFFDDYLEYLADDCEHLDDAQSYIEEHTNRKNDDAYSKICLKVASTILRIKGE